MFFSTEISPLPSPQAPLVGVGRLTARIAHGLTEPLVAMGTRGRPTLGHQPLLLLPSDALELLGEKALEHTGVQACQTVERS
jgi:hypothetical protein